MFFIVIKLTMHILQTLSRQAFHNTRIIKNKKTNKKIKDGKTNSQEEKSQTSKAPVSEKEIRDLKESKNRNDSKSSNNKIKLNITINLFFEQRKL